MKHKLLLIVIPLTFFCMALPAQSNLISIEAESGTLGSDYTIVTPLADGLGKFLGCAYGSSSKADFEVYWNQVVPENAGKWGSTEPTRDNFSWTALDEAYNFAKKNGFIYRHHVLIWGNQQPNWIEKLSQEEQLEEIKEWFIAVAERYPDINILEVINEPLHDPPMNDNNPSSTGEGQYIDALGGTGDTSYDWVITAFRMAREYFPATTKLMLNDYSIVNDGNATSKYLKIIDLLKKENLIDAIGIQGHYFSLKGSSSTISENLNSLAKAGLPIYVTEMDIDGPTDDKQLSEYKRLFPIFWEHTSVLGITLWGFRPGMWRTEQKAYLVNSDGSERPALQWLRDYLKDFVSVKEIEESSDIIVHPNPVTDGHLFITDAQNITGIKIFDLSGRKLIDQELYSLPVIEFNLNFKSGIYAIQLIEGEKIFVRKIVIK